MRSTRFDDNVSRRQRLRRWGPVVLAWAAMIVLAAVLGFVFDFDDYGLSVYDVYHLSAEAVRGGSDLYAGTEGWVYLYPPLLAQMLVPVAVAFDLTTGQVLWFAANVLITVATVALLAQALPMSQRPGLWLAAALFVPVAQALYIGQITVILLALIAWAWVAMHADQRRLAGALLALAAWLKVYPAVLVLYLLLKRDWRSVQGVALAGFALLAAQVAISGPEQMLHFFQVLFDLTEDGQPFAAYENLSAFAFASRLFETNAQVQPLVVDATLFGITRFLLTGGILLLTVLALLRSNARLDRAALDWRFDLEYGLVLLTILVLGSTLWVSGLPPLLLVYVQVWRSREAFAHPRTAEWACIASYVLIAVALVVIILGSRVVLPWTLLAVGFVGVMLPWALIVWRLLDLREPAELPLPASDRPFATERPTL